LKSVRVAILGACGWMGKCHSLGYRNLPLLYPEHNVETDIRWLVDEDEPKLTALGPAYRGARISTLWQDAIDDPAVDLVDICLPDHLHYEVAKAALERGKHVYCEKPFTSTVAEAQELAVLAKTKNLVTRVGHNFPKNPVHELTKELLANGEIGTLVLFKASMHVDVLADPETPFMWRCDGKLAPTGVVGDVASHIFSFIHMLIGSIDSLVADVAITTKSRPVIEGFGYGVQAKRSKNAQMREVTNPDLVTLLCNFRCGGRGVIDVSRVASGRRFLQTYEVYGTKGGIAFNFDEVNRLQVFQAKDESGRQGYRAIDVGAERRNYAAFLPVANFALGYNEFKAIEVCEVVNSVATGRASWPTFEHGHEIMKIVEACFRSSERRAWVDVSRAE
jgi:predicted dehydrogenase